jgi:hypothetical protein
MQRQHCPFNKLCPYHLLHGVLPKQPYALAVRDVHGCHAPSSTTQIILYYKQICSGCAEPRSITARHAKVSGLQGGLLLANIYLMDRAAIPV